MNITTHSRNQAKTESTLSRRALTDFIPNIGRINPSIRNGFDFNGSVYDLFDYQVGDFVVGHTQNPLEDFLIMFPNEWGTPGVSGGLR